jgi:hypothetical protein
MGIVYRRTKQAGGGGGTTLEKAIGSEINTGTDDAKYVTSKAIADSNIAMLADTANIAGINPQTGTTYVLALADAGKLIRCDNVAGITLTVPKNAVVPLPINTVITIEQQGAGRVTISPVDTDVTLNAMAGGLLTAAQFAVIQLIKVDTNTWSVIGGTI